MSGWVNPETMINDYSSFIVIPSRQGHRLIYNDGELCEVIAWQIETNNASGRVNVRPITIYGIAYEDMVQKYEQPNFTTKKIKQK